MTPGKLVAIEGGDGAGKTTQVRRVADFLRGVAPNREVVATREPSDGAIGRLIRATLTEREVAPGLGVVAPDPVTFALLYAADRADHLTRVVLPALARGALVLTDRYIASSIAYQGAALAAHAGGGRRMMDWVAALNANFPPADLLVVLDVRPEVARARLAARGGALDVLERQAELARRRADFYADLGAGPFGAAVGHVNGEGDLAEVTEAIVDVLTARGFA